MDERTSFKEVTVEAIKDDIWHAVYLPLPEKPTGEVIEWTHMAAQYCYFAARERAENPEWRGSGSAEPQFSMYGSDANVEQHTEAALNKVLELERRWPHYIDRIEGTYHIPTSAAELREEWKKQWSEPEPHERRTEDDAKPNCENERNEEDAHGTECSPSENSSSGEVTDSKLESKANRIKQLKEGFETFDRELESGQSRGEISHSQSENSR